MSKPEIASPAMYFPTSEPMRRTAEHQRLLEAKQRKANWQRWGAYLSERQWGTVREDYSQNQEPWFFFPHDHARSRAYRWADGAKMACLEFPIERVAFAFLLLPNGVVLCDHESLGHFEFRVDAGPNNERPSWLFTENETNPNRHPGTPTSGSFFKDAYRKDTRGQHVFSGGFLGLDNIGVFDRSKPLPGGGTLDQADATLIEFHQKR